MTPGRPGRSVNEVMSLRTRYRQARRWRQALRPDADLAQAEGLAAGLGLLTGDVVRSGSLGSATTPACPSCGGASEVAVVDLVGHSTTVRCRTCGRRWTTDHADTTSPRRAAPH